MRMRSVGMPLLFFAAVLFSTGALAKGDPAAGKLKSYTCLGCHGITDYTNAYPDYRVPKLAGQHAAYILQALKEYKSGDRSHPTMRAQAGTLSEQDMENIAAYFQSLGKKHK